MKKRTTFFILIFAAIFSSVLFCCSGSDDSSDDNPTSAESEWQCGTYNDHQLYTGPKGGCYYYNSNGNKTYVDKSNCHC